MGGRIAGTHALMCHCCLPCLVADHETAAGLGGGAGRRADAPAAADHHRHSDRVHARLAGHGVWVLSPPSGYVHTYASWSTGPTRGRCARGHQGAGGRGVREARGPGEPTDDRRSPPSEGRALHEVTGRSMTGAPPRGLEERLRDTRAKLESDVDLWVATSGSPGGVHLIPLSYLWDGTAFLISTPRASLTGRNLLADGSTVRPSACGGVAVAQLRRAGYGGRPAGRSQRRCAAHGLRQVHRRPGGDGQSPDRGGSRRLIVLTPGSSRSPFLCLE
jgi:hypothetical protein